MGASGGGGSRGALLETHPVARALGSVRARWGALVRRRHGELQHHWQAGVAALRDAAVAVSARWVTARSSLGDG